MFKDIRIACMPEVVLAYAQVLNISAHYLSRDYYLKSMDLAAMIAVEGSDVADCFMAAGRMTELVTIFAHASRGVIAADEKPSKEDKSRRKMDGKSMDIWCPKVIVGRD